MSAFLDQLSADLAEFFNPEAFGKQAVYTPVSGPAVETVVLFEEGMNVQEGAMGANPAAIARLMLKESDVPDPQQHDTIEIDNATWTVINKLSRNLGVWTLLVAAKERLKC